MTGSSVSTRLRGETVWSFFTSGPVRFAPALSKGRVYAGSDDGLVYCLDAEDGRLLWKHKPSTPDRCVIGNGRMISVSPVRTGVAVDGGAVYFCAGIFPKEGVVAAALDAGTGKVLWEKSCDFSPQGYILASAGRLYVPTGRASPVVVDRRNGVLLGSFEGSAGAYALVTEGIVAYGPGDTGRLSLSTAESRDHLATFPGLHMIIAGTKAVLHTKTHLRAIDRVRTLEIVRQRNELSERAKRIGKEIKELAKKGAGSKVRKLEADLEAVKNAVAKCARDMEECVFWERDCAFPFALILAGDVLYAGGDGGLAGFSAEDGTLLWKAEVPGRVYGLAAANGRLFASTDEGTIQCFVEERSL